MSDILNARKERHIKFYNQDPDVKQLYHIHILTDGNENPRPQLTRSNRQGRIDFAAWMYETGMKRMEWLHDDYIPHATCITGTEFFAEAIGSNVEIPKGSEPYAQPFITHASEVSKIKVPRPEDSTLMWLLDMADDLKAKCGSGVVMGLPDVQTPMDICALIWDKTHLFMAMLDEPNAVLELAHKISVLWYEFFDEWFRRYGKEFVSHCPDYYMPSGITYSEDEVGAVSAEMFEELFLPELIDISNHYGNVGMHCCANSRHQWDNFLKIPNLKLLNLVQPNNVMLESSKFFAGKIPMFPSWEGKGEYETWFSQMDSGAHLILDFYVKDLEDAKALNEKMLNRR